MEKWKKNVTITMSLEQAKHLNTLLFANVITFASDCNLEESARFAKIGTIVSRAIKEANSENESEESE